MYKNYVQFLKKAALFLFLPMITLGLLFLLPNFNCDEHNTHQARISNQESSNFLIDNFVCVQQINDHQILTVCGHQALCDLTKEFITISGSCSIVSDHIVCKAQAGVFDMKAHKLSLHGDVETVIC